MPHYRDSTNKIKKLLSSMHSPTAGMFVWDLAKGEYIETLEMREVYYADNYATGSLLYPFLRLSNNTSSAKTVKVSLNFDGKMRDFEDVTIGAGKAQRFYCSTYSIGTHSLIWYVDGIEVLRVTYTIQSAQCVQIADAKVGNYVSFGSYEQDDNSDNGKEAIEWLVLAKENNRLLVISRYALDCKPYNKTHAIATWETCTLRTWLNNDFLKAAFSSAEQAMIPTMRMTAHKNPDYSTNPGNDTQDKIFLLSITEAEKYFSFDSARECTPTAYAKKQGAYTNSGGFCWWWLRSPGITQNRAANVYYDGSVSRNGSYVSYIDNGVRPALWIDLEP